MHDNLTVLVACRSCGAAQDPDARFCAVCGTSAPDPRTLTSEAQTPQLADGRTTMILPQQPGQNPQLPSLSVLEPVETAGGAPEGVPHKQWLTLIVKGLVAMSVLAAVAVLALNDIGTHQRLTQSREAYSASQARLQTTKVNLADTVSKLTGVQSTLASTEATLTTTKQALAARVQDLAGVQNNLTDVKSNLTIKSGQMETLKSCLNGVSVALNDFAYGDYSGAIAALNAVKVSCNSAYKLL